MQTSVGRRQGCLGHVGGHHSAARPMRLAQIKVRTRPAALPCFPAYGHSFLPAGAVTSRYEPGLAAITSCRCLYMIKPPEGPAACRVGEVGAVQDQRSVALENP